MRRLLALIVAAVLGLTLASLHPAPTQALAPAITGRLVDPSTDLGVPGMTVNLHLETPSGTIVSTTETDAEGDFSLSAPGGPEDQFVVEVVAGTLQAGYVKRYESFVLVDWTRYSRWDAGDDIGDIMGIPAYIKGKAVNARTGRAVAGVRVTLREAVSNDVVAAATTNSLGRFTITGIEGEDFNLKLQGSSVGYETGYRACNAQIVPTIGQACGSPLGQIGRLFLERL